MKGSPAKMGGISGTAGHSSALKMKAESALKAKNPKAKTYEEAYGDVAMKVGSKEKFMKDAKAYNMKTYGTENPTSTANKGGMTKKELAAKYKADSTGTKTTTTKGGKTTTNISDSKGDTKVVTKKNLLNKGTTTRKSTVLADGTTKESKFKKDKDGDNRMRKTTTKGTTDGGAYVKKSKDKFDKDGVRKKSKTTIKSDVDGDGKVDRKFKVKTNDKKGTEKTVVKEGGRRTVIKTDKEGNTKVKSRRTLKGFLTGKGKKTKKEETPVKKALVGNQKNLPEHLKAKIDAAPGKMYGKSMAKKYDK